MRTKEEPEAKYAVGAKPYDDGSSYGRSSSGARGTPSAEAAASQQPTPTAVKACPPKAGVPPIPSGYGRVDYSSAAAVRSSAAHQALQEPPQQEQLGYSLQTALVSAGRSPPQQQQHQAATAEFPRHQQQATMVAGGWAGWAVSRAAAPTTPSPSALMDTWGADESPTPGGMQTEAPPDAYVKQCLDRIVSHNQGGRKLNSQSSCGYGEWPNQDPNPPTARPFGRIEAPMGESSGQRVVTGMVPGFEAEKFVSLTEYLFPRKSRDQWVSAPLMPNMYSADYFTDPAFAYILQHQYRLEAPG